MVIIADRDRLFDFCRSGVPTASLLLRQQTQVINALRAHLAELGIVAAQGREGLKQLLAIIADEKDERLPIDARASLIVLAAQLQALHTMIGSIEKRLTVQHRANEASKRLESVPGIGIIGASAIATTLNGRRARSCVSQGYFSGFCLARRNTECAPTTRMRRR